MYITTCSYNTTTKINNTSVSTNYPSGVLILDKLKRRSDSDHNNTICISKMHTENPQISNKLYISSIKNHNTMVSHIRELISDKINFAS